jgi:amino acid transporter
MVPMLPAWAHQWLEIAKLLSVAVLFSGTLGAFLPQALADRQRAAYWLAGPGFGATWIVGFVLAWARGVSTLSWWIVLSMALSILSINAVLYGTAKDGRRSGTIALVAIVPLVLCVILMVLRP